MSTINGLFIKDLRIIGNRKLKDSILIDNYVHSFAFNIDNGIPIVEWRNDRND
jgi:CTD small phosphatase-like protein 2